MSSIVKLLAVSAAFLLSSSAFAGDCENDLMADQARLQRQAAKMKALYPYTEYFDKTLKEYESGSARINENKRLMDVDLFETSKTAEVIQNLIENKSTGVTQRGFVYTVQDKTLSLSKGEKTFTFTLDADFGPGFSVRNEDTGHQMRYSRQSLVERVTDLTTNRLDMFIKLQRFGNSIFEQSEVEAALDLSLSAQVLSPRLGTLSFESVEDFSATVDRYFLNGYYGLLPLETLKPKIRLLLRLNREVVIGDYDHVLEKVPAKDLKSFGETGDWLSITDENRVYLVKRAGHGENILFRSFSTRTRKPKPLGSLVISDGQAYPSADWIPENHRIVFALLLILRETGLE